MVLAHPWNTDPLPPSRYRLAVVHRRDKDKQLVAVSVSREALARLERDLAGLDYDFVRIERLEGEMAEQVGRQNTRALTSGEQAAYERMAVTGGASAGVFSWDIMNLGPSAIWVRWDGTDAVINDPNAISLPANTGYEGAITTLLTVAADQATTITFAVNDRG